MALLEVNWKPTGKDLRIFAVVQFIMFAILAWWLHQRFGWNAAAWTILAVTTAALVAGIAKPDLLRMPFIAWMLAAFPIGWVMSHLMLAIVYYGVVTPIGLILRWQGRDPLQLRPRPEVKSYWIIRPETADPSKYFQQF